MGYTTTLQGELTFNPPIELLAEIRSLKYILGKDLRELAETNEFISNYIKELNKDKEKYHEINLSYIDFELTQDMNGIQWDESEKFYHIVEKTQFVIDYMRHLYPYFGLEWDILCQWEDFKDRWILRVENNTASMAEAKLEGYTKCPECDHIFKIKQ